MKRNGNVLDGVVPALNTNLPSLISIDSIGQENWIYVWYNSRSCEPDTLSSAE